MVAGVETVLALGAQGVSLDLEPYPTTPGYLALLEEIRRAVRRDGLPRARSASPRPRTSRAGRPPTSKQVTARIDQVDPLFYDSERTTAAAYEQWVREGLAYYSANTAPGTRSCPTCPPTARTAGTIRRRSRTSRPRRPRSKKRSRRAAA